ncbi:MAG: hypothetical protein QOC59_1079 [Microbacteriaceae bacterium]|nr:hypothetical protein [Microbacteriaceae bacterium]
MQEAERAAGGHRLPGWLVFTVLRVLVFVVPLVVTMLLGASPLLAALIAAIVGLCLSLLFLSGSRGRYSSELANLRARPPAARESGSADELAEDSALDAADGQNASAAANPKP